jgi:hydrogenase 3 maturation protease
MAAKQQFFEKLNKLRDTKTVIVGIGNTLKGDDGAGPWVCQKLQEARVSAELIDAGTVPENYIQPIISKSPQNLIIIDAIDSGAPPVDMVCLSIDVNVFFIGIQPAQVNLGQSVSHQVEKSIQWLTNTFTQIFPPEERD